jgi:hypothetical protein
VLCSGFELRDQWLKIEGRHHSAVPLVAEDWGALLQVWLALLRSEPEMGLALRVVVVGWKCSW